MYRNLIVPAVIATLVATTAQAATVVTTHPVTTTVNETAKATVLISSTTAPDTIGQVFVPTQAYLTSIGFRFGSTNSGTKSGDVTVSLYEGAIAPGASLPASALFTQRFSVTNLIYRGVGNYVDFSTGTLGVKANTAYTVVLNATSNIAIAYGTGEGYVPGYLLQTKLNNDICRNTPAACDASFRFTTASPAPEPAQWGMMLGGFTMIGGAVRYRRRRTTLSFR